MKSNAKIGTGIIGLSAKRGWAGLAHVPALRSLPEFELVALSTTHQETANAAANKYNVPFAFSNHMDLINHPDVDLVVVSVKVPYHHELVMAALQAGKMVYCEWPLGNGLNEAKEMAHLAKKNGIPAFTGLQARLSPEIRYVRDLVRSGYVGEVLSTSVVASVSASSWGESIAPESLYLLDPRNGATLLTIPFGHTVDALCWCLGEFEELTGVHAIRRQHAKNTQTGELVPRLAHDQLAVSGILENGAVASVHYKAGIISGTRLWWEINGTSGDIVVSSDSNLQFGNLKIRGVQTPEGQLADLPVPSEYGETEGNSPDRSYNLRYVYKAMLRDVNEKTHLLPTFDDAVIRHEMLDAIERAFESGTKQKISKLKHESTLF